MAVKVRCDFKERLIEAIKVAGEMLIENAEDIAGKTPHMYELNISINFPLDRTIAPEVTITRSHYPPRDKLERILGVYERKELLNESAKV